LSDENVEVLNLEAKKTVLKSNIDLQERDKLVKLSERYLDYDSLYVWNVNINGILIQLRTNDSTLDNFWKENWMP